MVSAVADRQSYQPTGQTDVVRSIDCLPQSDAVLPAKPFSKHADALLRLSRGGLRSALNLVHKPVVRRAGDWVSVKIPGRGSVCVAERCL